MILLNSICSKSSIVMYMYHIKFQGLSLFADGQFPSYLQDYQTDPSCPSDLSREVEWMKTEPVGTFFCLLLLSIIPTMM